MWIDDERQAKFDLWCKVYGERYLAARERQAWAPELMEYARNALFGHSHARLLSS